MPTIESVEADRQNENLKRTDMTKGKLAKEHIPKRKSGNYNSENNRTNYDSEQVLAGVPVISLLKD